MAGQLAMRTHAEQQGYSCCRSRSTKRHWTSRSRWGGPGDLCRSQQGVSYQIAKVNIQLTKSVDAALSTRWASALTLCGATGASLRPPAPPPRTPNDTVHCAV